MLSQTRLSSEELAYMRTDAVRLAQEIYRTCAESNNPIDAAKYNFVLNIVSLVLILQDEERISLPLE